SQEVGMAIPTSNTILEPSSARLVASASRSSSGASKKTALMHTTVSVPPAYVAARRPKPAASPWHSRFGINCPAIRASWQVREEPEYYIPDLLSDRDYAPDPALIHAAEAHTKEQREAMALLDDAKN